MNRHVPRVRASGSAIVLLLVMTACSRRVAPSLSDGAGDASSAAPAPSSAVSSVAPVAPAASVREPRGTATLIVQHVEAACIVGVGANGKGHFSVGTDLLVETADEGDAKPLRDFVFCPKRLADGGIAKPRLDTWQNCKAYPACKIVEGDGGPDRVEVLCGGERVILESASGRTLLRGSFGEREIAPFPMRIAPRKESRNAMVDC